MIRDLLLTGLFVVANPFVATGETIEFSRDVRPILADKCFACHGPDEATRERGIRFDVQEGLFGSTKDGATLVVPGNPEESEVYARITHPDVEERMPPSEFHLKLSASEIDVLRQWIVEGAAWQGHWAFVPPVNPALPEVTDAGWVRNAIDRFVLARLEGAGLRPGTQADRATLIRRVSLDLTGLPPTPDEVAAFVHDERADAYERVVDRLLASPAYGERMAFPWLNAARYSDTGGYQRDTKRFMWHWRDWVIDALNDNMPFDQFTIEQLAGDLLPEPTMSQRIATGFNRNHRINGEGGIIPEEYAVEYVVDRVSTTATTWMGLTMECARCHDHKFDPISQREFYEFYDFFNRVPEEGKGREQGNDRPFIRVATEEQSARSWLLEETVARLEADLLAPDPELDAAQRTWESELAERFAGLTWTAVRPAELTSATGVAVEVLDDDSLFVSGSNPANQTIEISFEAVESVRSLRLELLLDERLPERGPGRGETGNVIITDVEVLREREGETVAVDVAKAYADFARLDSDYAIGNAIDESEATGWSAGSHLKREDRVAVFSLGNEALIEPGDRVRVRFAQGASFPQHTLGRFRVSYSTGDEFSRWAQPVFGAWDYAGPMAAEGGVDPFEVAFGPEDGFDANAVFADEVRWERRAEWTDGIVHAFPPQVNSVYYLRRTVQVSAPTALTLSLGSDDALRVWVDGELRWSNMVKRDVAADQDRVELVLSEGEHELLMKVVNYSGTAGFYFRAMDDGGEGLFSLMALLSKEDSARTSADVEALQSRYRMLGAGWLAKSRALDARRAELQAANDSIVSTMVMEEMDDPRDTHLLKRGVYDNPDESEVLHASVPSVLGEMPEDLPRNRLGLARWLLDPGHPLTSRVRVNQYWLQYFGRGLVRTAEDFGTQGTAPSHPKLLDWLAIQFVESGWDVKAMQKLIVMSATYRQSSRQTAEQRERDPENVLLGRAPRYRLPSETLRDQALAVSGLLNPTIGGPSVYPYQPEAMWSSLTFQNMDEYDTNFYRPDTGDNLYRRGMYTFWKRTIPPPRMKIFDSADRERCVIRTENTNTPMQAMALLNDPTFVEAARHLGRRMIVEGGEKPTDRIRYGYTIAMAHEPEPAKGWVLVKGLENYLSHFAREPAAARALLGVGDSAPDATIDETELAAYTALASVMMNLDEFITRE